MSEPTPGSQYKMAMAEENPPSIEIKEHSTVIRRRGNRLVEEQSPAYIAIYTSFKQELAHMDGAALKVWIYLALSLNRFTEEAHPGVRTIAKTLRMGENTVTNKIRDLEAIGLLTVHRRNRKYNIYAIPNYATAGRTASKIEADAQTASENMQTASENAQTASAFEQRNHITIEPFEEEEKQKIKLDGDYRILLTAYEAFHGSISTAEMHMLGDLLDHWRIHGRTANRLPSDVIMDAVKITAENADNRRSMSYTRKIVQSWIENGYGWKPKGKYPSGKKYPGKSIQQQIAEA